MVESFNGRINELLQQTRFDSRAHLETTLLNYLKLYNHHIPQRAIGSKTPILALTEWEKKRPELFVKKVYDQTGLDSQYSRSRQGCARNIQTGMPVLRSVAGTFWS